MITEEPCAQAAKSRLGRLIYEPRHIKGQMDGRWGLPPFTARPVVVTPFLTPAAYPGLTEVTLGEARAPSRTEEDHSEHPVTLRGASQTPRGGPDPMIARLTRSRASWRTAPTFDVGRSH